MSLNEQGWRFVLRGVTFLWVPMLEDCDIDLTYAPDDELQAHIDRISA